VTICIQWNHLGQVACDINHKWQRVLDKRKKSTNTSSSFDFIVYILSHATKMWLFWSLLKAKDVLPCVSTFNYLKYTYYYYCEII
jgi:hypothetical protein